MFFFLGTASQRFENYRYSKPLQQEIIIRASLSIPKDWQNIDIDRGFIDDLSRVIEYSVFVETESEALIIAHKIWQYPAVSARPDGTKRKKATQYWGGGGGGKLQFFFKK